jgi:hypothetical protein
MAPDEADGSMPGERDTVPERCMLMPDCVVSSRPPQRR